jgi:AAA family ATP:ADP antiporter
MSNASSPPAPRSSTATERRVELFVAIAAAALLVAQQVASKAARDALFLSSFDPRRLPIAMAGGAALSLFAVFVMARALTVRGPARVMPWALGLNATLFLVEWVALPIWRKETAVIVYLHVAALGSVLISGFWSVISERFDPHTARPFVARVTMGATAGGLIGGFSTELIAGDGGVRTVLVVLAAGSVVTALLLRRMARDEASAATVARSEEGSPDEGASSIGRILRAPYLRSLGMMSLLAAVWAALLDFAFKSEAARAHPDEGGLVTFFAVFYTGTSLLTFIVQALSSRFLKNVRLGLSVGVLPAVVAIGGVASFLTGSAVSIWALRGLENVLSNSIYRSSYELFFTPLPRATKRPTKTLVDVAATRVGDAVGSLVVLALIQSWRGMPLTVPVIAAAGAAMIALFLVGALARGYVESLQAALRSGTIELDEASAVDPTTRRTLSDTTMAIDRERLLAEIEALRKRSERPSAPTDEESVAQAAAAESIAAQPLPQVEGEVPAHAQPPAEPHLVQRFVALASGASDRARDALREPLQPELVPVALPLLAHPTIGRQALSALRAVAPRVTGTLVDALLDSQTPFEVRFRIPRVLRAVATRRAAVGLVQGLDDPRLEVRFQCARALVHLAAEDGSLAPARETIFECVERELSERGATWNAVAHSAPSHDPHHDGHEDEPLSLDDLVRMRASRSLQYVLTLLSLVVDGEALQLALRGLSSHEDKIRGTAIELLENVLPDPVRRSLIPVLAIHPHEPQVERSREELVTELLRSQESLPLIRPREA